MVLGRELLRAEGVGCCDFSSEVAGVVEAERVEGNLGNHSVVRHHHSHCSEESLQVVGKFWPSSIPGVHCDENVAGSFEGDIGILEEENLFALFSGNGDGQNLLCNHRQHLKVDSVELIETWPGTWWGQSFEEFTHSPVVKTIWAVEHHALSGEGFGQIFDCLGFSCSSRALGCTSVVQAKCSA